MKKTQFAEFISEIFSEIKNYKMWDLLLFMILN